MLDKRVPEQDAIFRGALLDAHFLFLPSRAEAYGQAFCEAAAFGVPSIGSTSGGIPTIIRDGETGYVLPADADPKLFADRIHGTFAAPDRYRDMARAARADYLARLNWDSFGLRLTDLINGLLT
jgi:glycosyltransferase involved in cell wall biosynthesis